MPQQRLLLISNSRNGGRPFLSHAESSIRSFLGGTIQEVLFVPYAGVVIGFDEYTSLVRPFLQKLGYKTCSVHEVADPVKAVERSEAIAIGGGNTFALLRGLADHGLLPAIRAHARQGKPYLGWSAGANVACPTIQTTNDMPITWLPSPAALDLVPFQINPHFVDGQPEGTSGETREQRIAEFSKLHPKTFVVGLREGTMLQVHGNGVRLVGDKPAKVFVNDQPPRECHPTEPLDFLMESPRSRAR